MGISKRGQSLKDQVVSFTPSISAERAEIVTRSYKKYGHEDPLILRARALEDILDNKTLYILEKDLLAGNQAPRPRCAEVFPEFSTRWILKELNDFEKRDSDIFTIDEDVKRRLRDILPWWEGRCVQDRVLQLLPQKIESANRDLVFILTSLSSGVGHIAVDYERCIRYGLRRIIDDSSRLEAALIMDSQEAIERRNFFRAVRIVCEALIRFARRCSSYARKRAAEETDPERQKELSGIAEICSRIPEEPARTFHEALQSFWFVHLVLQIESNGHSISPGRFDQYMYPWYRRDLDAGLLTRDRGKELLENLWIKMNELIKLRDLRGSKAFGGYPLFQNIIVGGVDEYGRDASNELSFLCMEVTRELKLPQPSFSVRWHAGTPRRFMTEAASVVKGGFGMPAFFNDEVIIPMMLDMGYSFDEARNYTEVGCVEPQTAGTTEGYYPSGFMNLSKVLELTLNNGTNPLTGNRIGVQTGEDFDNFADFYEAYLTQLGYFCDLMADAINCIDSVQGRYVPTPFCSCFVDDCLESGTDVRRGGARYNFSSPNVVALANVADALMVLKEAVFKEKKVSYGSLRKILRDNYDGNEVLRQRFLKDYPKYGNDNDEVDSFARDIALFLDKRFRRRKNVRGGCFYVGLQSISAHALFVNSLGATPDGRKMEMLLADGGCSPAQGRDRLGPTAIACSVAKIDHFKVPNGTLLNIKLNPSLLETTEGIQHLITLIESYFTMKGQHVQFNVVSADVLRAAQKSPEEYGDLVVRVAGFSVYFVSIDRILQEDIIQRTEQSSFG
ncbi:glycyl radical protein [Marispirochaeta aestuarii]|uniref:glycyl radical protein n=1 Tax=Marispirochaeta aestuarii TaxID=1963862 RepID=UPI002ABE7F97|nr:glycyl radical protein [Marispirochaeta aestuarii]